MGASHTVLISLQTKEHNLAPFIHYYTESQHRQRLKSHSVTFNHLCKVHLVIEKACCSVMISQLIIHLHVCVCMCMCVYIFTHKMFMSMDGTATASFSTLVNKATQYREQVSSL